MLGRLLRRKPKTKLEVLKELISNKSPDFKGIKDKVVSSTENYFNIEPKPGKLNAILRYWAYGPAEAEVATKSQVNRRRRQIQGVLRALGLGSAVGGIAGGIYGYKVSSKKSKEKK